MKKAILVAVIGAMALGVNAGDWGKAPVESKAPIEECIDIGGNISFGYESDYIYKGYHMGRDTLVTDVNYGLDMLPVPVTIGVNYANIIGGAGFWGDHLALYAVADVATVAGFDLAVSYTHRFSPEFGFPIDPSEGEIGLHATRDLGVATLSADVFYNFSRPDSLGVGLVPNNDNGAWYWDFGLERSLDLMGQSLVLAGGVAYSDNYWDGITSGSTGRSGNSGWNHYYLNASLPIELNCRATVTPYVGYTGAPDGFLMDGAVWGGQTLTQLPQTDVFHWGVNLSVNF